MTYIVLLKQVKMLEIFDVTKTDPSLLVKDQLDNSLDTTSLRLIFTNYIIMNIKINI